MLDTQKCGSRSCRTLAQRSYEKQPAASHQDFAVHRGRGILPDLHQARRAVFPRPNLLCSRLLCTDRSSSSRCRSRKRVEWPRIEPLGYPSILKPLPKPTPYIGFGRTATFSNRDRSGSRRGPRQSVWRCRPGRSRRSGRREWPVSS